MKKFFIRKQKPLIEQETKMAASRSVEKATSGIAFILDCANSDMNHKQALENYFMNFTNSGSEHVTEK